MSIKSFTIRAVRKVLDHLETEPRLLIIESDDYKCPMHTINEMLRKKYTYRYNSWRYSDRYIEVSTTVATNEIADVIRSLIGRRYDVVVTNGDINLVPLNTDK